MLCPSPHSTNPTVANPSTSSPHHHHHYLRSFRHQHHPSSPPLSPSPPPHRRLFALCHLLMSVPRPGISAVKRRRHRWLSAHWSSERAWFRSRRRVSPVGGAGVGDRLFGGGLVLLQLGDGWWKRQRRVWMPWGSAL